LNWNSAIGAFIGVTKLFGHIGCQTIVVKHMKLATLKLHYLDVNPIFCLLLIVLEANRAFRTFTELS